MLSSLYYSNNSLPKHSERWFWLCWIQVYYFLLFFPKTDQRVLERIFNLFSYSFHFLHWSSESIVDFGGFIPVYSRRTISILSIHFVFFVSIILILAFILCTVIENNSISQHIQKIRWIIQIDFILTLWYCD